MNYVNGSSQLFHIWDRNVSSHFLEAQYRIKLYEQKTIKIQQNYLLSLSVSMLDIFCLLGVNTFMLASTLYSWNQRNVLTKADSM
jgi:hypothetical protein